MRLEAADRRVDVVYVSSWLLCAGLLRNAGSRFPCKENPTSEMKCFKLVKGSWKAVTVISVKVIFISAKGSPEAA